MSFDVTSVGLPKWPAMVVRGERVTIEQAAEIIVRTDPWQVSTNDKAWQKLVREAVGLPPDDWDAPIETMRARWEETDRWREALGVLPLEYLYNAQIASCYIGGPHGWCAWNGRIGSDSTNIGKWPSAEGVLEEWRTIASTFPFLSLTCQLFSGETCEEGTRPLVEYVVAEGRATARSPEDRTMAPNDADTAGFIASIAMGLAGRERGCTIDQLKAAVERTRAKLAMLPGGEGK